MTEQLAAKQSAVVTARSELDAFRNASSLARQALAAQISDVLQAEKNRLAQQQKSVPAQISKPTPSDVGQSKDDKSGASLSAAGGGGGSGLRVLCIDGGGTRGVIPITVLEELERRSGKRIFELFDLICGTSTGGIIALAVSTLGLSAFECRQKYLSLADSVFRGNSVDKAARMMVGTTIYSVANLERFLNETFRDAKLDRDSKASQPITPSPLSAAGGAVGSGGAASPHSVNGLVRQPMAFVVMRKNADPGPFLARNYNLPSADRGVMTAVGSGGASAGATFQSFGHSGESGWLSMHAARATSAAPLYFPPYSDSIGASVAAASAPGDKKHSAAAAGKSSAAAVVAAANMYTDGGVGYNNSTEIALNEICALTQAMPSTTHIRCIVSLGTGNAPPDLSLKNKLLVTQVAGMLVAQCSSSEDVHQRMVRSCVLHGLSDRYFRLNPALPEQFPLDTAEIEKLTYVVRSGVFVVVADVLT